MTQVETSQDHILSVKQLNRYIKMKLESDVALQDVWVRGEISNFTHHSSGHMYFTLKDKDSRLKCVMFASHNQRLPFMPKDGTKVIARGSISVFERDGNYQMYVTHMQPDGIGSLYLAFEQLKKKLDEEGLFHPERKKPIPRFPKVVGVITSPTGAAVRDIITTLHRRHPSVPILLYPVLVQGTQAAASIVKAIRVMNERSEVDVLIVGRGGGSLEELWCFNEESVARAISESDIPIISAVGHETDFTIADFVADLRAATPTAAAELAVPHVLELKQQVHYFSGRLHQGLIRLLQTKQDKLSRLRRSAFFTQPKRQLLYPAERLDRLKDQLRHRVLQRVSRSRDAVSLLQRTLAGANPKDQAIYARRRVEAARRGLTTAMMQSMRQHKQELGSNLKQLDALSPLKVMQRGYSLIYDEKQQQIIKSIQQVQLGDLVKVRLSDGQLDCQVWAMKGEESNGANGTEL